MLLDTSALLPKMLTPESKSAVTTRRLSSVRTRKLFAWLQESAFGWKLGSRVLRFEEISFESTLTRAIVRSL